MKKVVITVISVLVLLFIVFLFGGIYLTHKLISDKTGILITAAENETPQKFNYSEIDTLPPVLQKYFRFALEDGITKPRFLRLKQKGEFKTSISADFRDIEAQQYFLTSKPGFLWHGKIYLTSFLWLDGIDTYFNGDGALLIKFLSGISMTRETGDEIKQAQIVRWLLEAAWFPAALLPNENLKWIKYDSTSATLLFNEKDIEIKARFFFNGNGS